MTRDAVKAMYWPNVDKALFDEIWSNWTGAYPRSIEIPPESVKKVVDFTNLLEAKKIDPGAVEKAWTNTYAREALRLMPTR
jgi:hypothetical protein